MHFFVPSALFVVFDFYFSSLKSYSSYLKEYTFGPNAINSVSMFPFNSTLNLPMIFLFILVVNGLSRFLLIPDVLNYFGASLATSLKKSSVSMLMMKLSVSI